MKIYLWVQFIGGILSFFMRLRWCAQDYPRVKYTDSTEDAFYLAFYVGFTIWAGVLLF